MAKSKPKSPFTGSWHILSMSAWEDDYLDEEIQAFIEIDEKGSGSFQFGYVKGYMAWRSSSRDGEPAIEWSWEGPTKWTRPLHPESEVALWCSITAAWQAYHEKFLGDETTVDLPRPSPRPPAAFRSAKIGPRSPNP